MSTSIEHYQAAEQIWADRKDLAEVYGGYAEVFAAAQLHATLALAAATALSPASDGGPLADFLAWHKAASVEAPIPPKTDDEDEPDGDVVRVGSLSPTGDMDARELTAWLRRVPPGSTLIDVDGDGWYRLVSLSLTAGERRRCQTVVCADGSGVRDLADHDDMLAAKQFAPFTVLTLGSGAQDGA